MKRLGLDLYTATAYDASARVLQAYSTSFGLARKLLPTSVRPHVEAIYALVRIADEVVDGPAVEAGLDRDQCIGVLNELETETLRGMRTGFSANLAVHAFGVTAREIGLHEEWVTPFFASMRTDAEGQTSFDDDAYRRYIYGSAEVVGVMCAHAFVHEDPEMRIDDDLVGGARRLGAAFQKINFLRDLADDSGRLGRVYFPGLDPASFGERDKHAILDDIDGDLAAARESLIRLPPGGRKATAAAVGMFTELSTQLRLASPAEIMTRRFSVSRFDKAKVIASVLARGGSR